jgi:hypothetical protein
MKNILILTIALTLSGSSFAQKNTGWKEEQMTCFAPQNIFSFNNNPAARTTAAGDTFTLKHLLSTDTITIYKNDSGGYATGTNFWGDKAFAERYDFNGTDSSVRVLGLLAMFAGRVNPASTQTVSFNVWDQSGHVAISNGLYYNGFPANILTSQTVPVTQLGIGVNVDTMKQFWFTTPTDLLSSSFFIGYSINYNYQTLNGDTIGLAGSKNGHRTPAYNYTLVYNTSVYDTTLDTMVNVQNATLQYDNRWYDNYTQNDSIKNNLAIFPIVVIEAAAGLNGVTKNDFTLFGNYPNPAGNQTTVKYALTSHTDISLQIMDMAGRTISTIQQANQAPGTHTIDVPTGNLAVGDYLYLIRTTQGTGMAGKFSKL